MKILRIDKHYNYLFMHVSDKIITTNGVIYRDVRHGSETSGKYFYQSPERSNARQIHLDIETESILDRIIFDYRKTLQEALNTSFLI